MILYIIYILFLEEKHGRETLVIVVDFSGGMEIYSMIKDQLDTLDIGILGECCPRQKQEYGLATKQ